MHRQAWPTFDPALASARELTLVVQIDGKVRDRITVAPGLDRDTLRTLALSSAKIRTALHGAEPANVIVVPDRLVSIVTK